MLASTIEAGFPNTRLLVVDDGSPPIETRKLLGEIEAVRDIHPSILKPLLLPANVGKGGAILKGWTFGDAYEALGFVDADGAVSAGEVAKLLRRFADSKDHHAALFGSRSPSSECRVERSVVRHLMGRCFAFIVSALVDNTVYDTQCGIKLLSSRAYQKIASLMDGMRFAFDVELLAALRATGEPIEEIPVEWQHIPNSKINFFRDTLQMVRAVWTIRRKLNTWTSPKRIK